MNYINALLGVLALLLGVFAGYFIRQFVSLRQRTSADRKVKERIEEANIRAKEITLEAQERASALLEEVKRQEREAGQKLGRQEERLLKKEEALEKDIKNLKIREEQLSADINRLKSAEAEIAELKQRELLELEKVTGLSGEQAKELLFKKIEDEYRNDLSKSIQKFEKERSKEIEKRSVEIITTAIQRYARSHVSEVTTSVFPLPSEDFKGKIIGKDGRNIRALERVTGVEFVIDETPDSIVISSFDPLRREIAKQTLQKLIKDGRIQPAKIEEKVEEAKSELDKRMTEIGEAAAYEVGVFDLPQEVIQLLGRLHFRTSFGQNVLVHSIEMAHLAGMVAGELGLNVEVAKKAALLHDIGKAIDHEVVGTHVEIGRKLLKKYGISDEVIYAMQSHHEEYPYASPESYVVTAVDVLSAARPGARRGTLENYIKRLEDLEKIALSFPAVKNAYAISAGRELRIFVTPEKIDDFGALQLARDIAVKIESELKYPGEIKVNVIREIRAVEYAK